MNAAEKPIVMMTRAELEELLVEKLGEVLEADSRPAPLPRMLTQDELAAVLNVTSKTVRTMRAKGLPWFMVCESPRFDLAEVKAWLRTLAEQAKGQQSDKAEKSGDLTPVGGVSARKFQHGSLVSNDSEHLANSDKGAQ